MVFSVILLVGCATQLETSQTDGRPDIVVDSGGNYIKFEQGLYEKSLDEDKVILLDFYANWCPICNSEKPKIIAGLNELNDPNVIAYQVHIKDDEETDDTKALAKKFGVTLQYTKIILKNGEMVTKSLEPWSKEKTINELKKVI